MRMVEAGTGHLANGNIRAARMMLKPAAEAGDPVAAFTYAETYDPLVLGKVVIRGGMELKADVGAALAWYRKAKNLGSTIAADRLDNLAHVSE
jgi:TPR repeat protein